MANKKPTPTNDPWAVGVHFCTNTFSPPDDIADIPPEEPVYLDEWGNVCEKPTKKKLTVIDMVNNPELIPDDMLKELAERSNDPNVAEELRARGRDSVAQKFVDANPDYYPSQRNADAIENYIEAKGWAYTTDNIESAYYALLASGGLEQNPNAWLELSTQQITEFKIRAANAENVEQLGQVAWDYLAARAPRTWRRQIILGDRTEFASANPDLCAEAAYAVFTWSCPDYIETPARVARFTELTKDKFVTIPLLDNLWQQMKVEEKDKAHTRYLFGDQSPTTTVPSEEDVRKQLEELPEKQFEELRQRQMRERVRNRKGSGIFV